MQPSRYNIFVSVDDKPIIFNTVMCQHMELTREVQDVLDGKSTDEKLLALLVAGGFVVLDGIDEANYVKGLAIRRRIALDTYHLTVNTTMDCNLRCAYCYERHEVGSALSDELIESIGNHLYYKSTLDKFKTLELTLFGGEPLLNPNVVEMLVGKVYEMSRQWGFKVVYKIVTNGTLVSERVIGMFKPYATRFQITLDGLENNSGRKSKQDSILASLRRISEVGNFTVNLRINYDAKTIKSVNLLADLVDFMPRGRTVVTLHKIWQEEEDRVAKSDIENSISVFNDKGFVVGSLTISQTSFHCVSDLYSQAVINYDGNVFKCTARAFDKAHRLGRLSKYGIIDWNQDKVRDYLSLDFASCCQECKLMPSCPGICSQTIMEARDEGREIECSILSKFSPEEIVKNTLRQNALRYQYEEA